MSQTGQDDEGKVRTGADWVGAGWSGRRQEQTGLGLDNAGIDREQTERIGQDVAGVDQE